MTFREQYMKGELPFDAIFDYTDEWNYGGADCTLREYLGLTPEEEDVWVSESDEALETLLEKEKNRKIIFLDLDGTLLNDEKQFTPGNRKAVKQALRAGHQIVITTGRPLFSALAQAEPQKKRVFIKKRFPFPTFGISSTPPGKWGCTARPTATRKSLQKPIRTRFSSIWKQHVPTAASFLMLSRRSKRNL